MEKEHVKHFDVLIVYSHNMAKRASSKNYNTRTPFSHSTKRSHYDDAYAYLIKSCDDQNINTAFTTSKDLDVKGGIFTSYWTFRNSKWKKVLKKCTAPIIFDKFSPKSKNQKKRRKQLFISKKIQPFNCPKLFSLFFDKQKTFNQLSKYAIPTVSLLKKDRKGIEIAYKKLEKLISNHPNSSDFSKDFVLKDRFGAGGNSIYKLSSIRFIKQITKILKQENANKSFILQPFTKFNKGYYSKKQNIHIDIRLIYLNSQIVQTYVRKAKTNDFRCNEHQGGTLEYLKKEDIPIKIKQFSKQIVKKLKNNTSLYALDYVISNNGNVYLMEGNTGPGIDWNIGNKKNEKNAKELITKIAKELSERVTKLNIEKLEHILPQQKTSQFAITR